MISSWQITVIIDSLQCRWRLVRFPPHHRAQQFPARPRRGVEMLTGRRPPDALPIFWGEAYLQELRLCWPWHRLAAPRTLSHAVTRPRYQPARSLSVSHCVTFSSAVRAPLRRDSARTDAQCELTWRQGHARWWSGRLVAGRGNPRGGGARRLPHPVAITHGWWPGRRRVLPLTTTTAADTVGGPAGGGGRSALGCGHQPALRRHRRSAACRR